MNRFIVIILIALALNGTQRAQASDNGGYYACMTDKLATDNICVYNITTTAPSSWNGVIRAHNLTTTGAQFKRRPVDLNGQALSISPKPWTNKDDLVTTTETQSGAQWNYNLIFQLIAPLRNKIMFTPETLNATSEWLKYTKAFTSCGIKEEDETVTEGQQTITGYSTDNTRARFLDPNGYGGDNHHVTLQYMEEGAIDLVCLVTAEADLSMSRCTTIREKMNLADGSYCNCWFDAWEAIYGSAPDVDSSANWVSCSSTSTASHLVFSFTVFLVAIIASIVTLF